jgi:hypothetical protein
MSNHPDQPDTPHGYLSYLLRLSRTHSEGGPVWRASLEDPLTRDVWRFDSLPGLFAFLRGQVGPGGRGDGAKRDNPPATAL